MPNQTSADGYISGRAGYYNHEQGYQMKSQEPEFFGHAGSPIMMASGEYDAQDGD